MLNSVQSLSCVQLFVTLWTTPCQASLSIINSQSLLKLMSIESVMPFSHLTPCHPLLLLPSIFPSIKVFWISINSPMVFCFPPSVLCSLILGLLTFHISKKEFIEILIWIVLNLYIKLGRIEILTTLSLLIHGHGVFLHLLIFSLIFCNQSCGSLHIVFVHILIQLNSCFIFCVHIWTVLRIFISDFTCLCLVFKKQLQRRPVVQWMMNLTEDQKKAIAVQLLNTWN